MSIPVKCVFAALHQIVNTAISHAYTSSGRLNCSVWLDTKLPVENLPSLGLSNSEREGYDTT